MIRYLKLCHSGVTSKNFLDILNKLFKLVEMFYMPAIYIVIYPLISSY